MDKQPPLKGDVIGAFADHLSLPKSLVRQTIDALRAAERIAATPARPTPITPRAIARIALALTSPSIRKCVETERTLGSLSYRGGEGQLTPEDEISDFIETSAGWRYRDDFNVRDGVVLVAHDDLAVTVGESRYSARESRPGAFKKFTTIKLSALAAIANELLPSERGVA